MWNIPRWKIEPVLPEWTGRFLTNGPPGKSSKLCVFFSLYIVSYPYKWWQVEHPVAIPARICILLHLSSFLGRVLWRLWWRWIVSFGISLVPFQYPSHSSAASAYCPIHPPAIFFLPNPHAPTTPVYLSYRPCSQLVSLLEMIGNNSFRIIS